MRTLAYGDFVERLREPVALVRRARGAFELIEASACSKGAVVLVVAAIERYMNHALTIVSQRLRVTSWLDLPDAHKHYLCQQMGRKLESHLVRLSKSRQSTQAELGRFSSVVSECAAAFVDPSTWQHLAEFGMFLDGAAAPEKIERVLRDCDPERRSFFGFVEEEGFDRGVFARALSQLVECRHACAHALQAGPEPSPLDAQEGLVTAFWLVRAIERFLGCS